MAIEERLREEAGDIAVQIFRIADGRTIDEIARKLGLTPAEVERIVTQFEGRWFRIIREKKPEEKIVIAKKEIVEIDLPTKLPLDKLAEASLGLSLTTEIGPSAKKIWDAIDGKKDEVQLACELGLKIEFVDDVLYYLAKKGVARFPKLQIPEIKHRYGTIGVRLYEKWGRDGVYLYALLERYADAVTAIKASGIPAERALDIYEEIHKLLSLPIPFDRRVLESAIKA